LSSKSSNIQGRASSSSSKTSRVPIMIMRQREREREYSTIGGRATDGGIGIKDELIFNIVEVV
jgi:hypothetical protein